MWHPRTSTWSPLRTSANFPLNSWSRNGLTGSRLILNSWHIGKLKMTVHHLIHYHRVHVIEFVFMMMSMFWLELRMIYTCTYNHTHTSTLQATNMIHGCVWKWLNGDVYTPKYSPLTWSKTKPLDFEAPLFSDLCTIALILARGFHQLELNWQKPREG